MATILYHGTHATDDPTRASMPFVGANGAKEGGHDPVIALVGDGVYVIKDQIRDSITPVGWPPLKEIMATTIANATPIYVWGGWARARAVTDQDLVGKNARFMTPVDFANLIAQTDKSISYWRRCRGSSNLATLARCHR